MNSHVLVFAAILAVVKCSNPECPYVTAKFPFDDAKFAGDWYAIAYVSNPNFNDLRCGKVSVAAFKDEAGTTLNYKFDYFAHGKPQISEAISYSKGGSNGASNNIVFNFKEDNKFSAVYKQSIIATDYDNYAVAIYCSPQFNSETRKFRRSLIANIYARGKTMSEDTLKTLKSIITSYDIEYDSIKAVVHDC